MTTEPRHTGHKTDRQADDDTPADVMRALHGLMQDKGLFVRGPQEDYWYSVFDGLVAELAPELANDDETRPA